MHRDPRWGENPPCVTSSPCCMCAPFSQRGPSGPRPYGEPLRSVRTSLSGDTVIHVLWPERAEAAGAGAAGC